MVFKYLVAKNDIKGLPGLEKGTPVIRVAVEVMEGGYEYDVWHILNNGLTAMTRVKHRDEFEVRVVEGDDVSDVIKSVEEAVSGL